MAEAIGAQSWWTRPQAVFVMLAVSLALILALAANIDEVEDLFGAWAADRSSDDCVRLLNAAGAPCGAFATAKEALAHPHLAARGSFAELEDADGAFKVLSPPFRLGGASAAAGDFVARLGQHTADVLAELAARSEPSAVAART